MDRVIDIFRNAIFKRKIDDFYLRGKSLFLLGPENKFRKLCYRFSESYFVGIIIFIMIVAQTVTLAL